MERKSDEMAGNMSVPSEYEVDFEKMAKMKLTLAAQFYAQRCSTVSRHYMLKAASLSHPKKMSPAADCMTCQHCGTLFMPDNHTARLIPKMKVNKSLTKLLQKQKQNPRGPLSRLQEKLLKLYKLSKNRLMIRCKQCKKRTTVSCQKRQINRPKKMSVFSGKGVEYLPIGQERKLSWKEKRKQKQKLKKKEKFEQARRIEVSTTSTDSGVSSNSSFSSLSKSLEDSQLAPLSPHKTSTPVSAMKEGRARSPSSQLHPFSLTQSVTSLAPSTATTSIHSSLSSPLSLPRSPPFTPASTDRKQPILSSRLLPSPSSMGPNKPVQTDSSKKSHRRSGSLHATLSRMLASEEKKKESSSTTLRQFLSSL